MEGAAWVAVVAAAIALGAGIAAVLQVQEMKRQTELQLKIHQDSSLPYVWADFRIDEVHAWNVHVVIRNEGPTIATIVQVHFDPPLRRVRSTGDFGDLSQLTAFTSGIASLSPGKEMRWSLGPSNEVYKEGSVSRHQVTVKCDGPFGPMKPLTYELDFGSFPGAASQPVGSLDRIERAITAQAAKVDQALRSLQQE